MGEPLVLRIDDLRKAVRRALAATEQMLGPEVVLTDDYYWHLSVEEAFDMTQEPNSLTVGQLSDDLAWVRDTGELPESAWHDLQHLRGLVRALERQARP